ncbi:MAG: hypothetical protein HC802_01080 [Caldilineaceae bacterium]|nr:hypothetical protein [Caldilineaceae bacterium]
MLKRYTALRTWRTAVANHRGVGPEIVMNNGLLLKIAEQAPRSPAELEEIAEIGPWKASTYGSEILQVIREN